MEIICFLAGTVFFYTKSFWPLCLILVVLVLGGSRTCIAWFLAACVWTWCHQLLFADQGMPDAAVIQKATLEGYVDSIPVNNSSKTQFAFLVQQLNGKPVKATILMACYNHCPVFKWGQKWRLYAKLKIPENLGNPGSFNYQAFLETKHIHWVGYLKKTLLLLQEKPNKNTVAALREWLSEKLVLQFPQLEILGIVQALTLGITHNLSKFHWELFRRTGTTHLLVISGSHIALVAGFMYALFRYSWSRFPKLCLLLPATQIAAITALIIATIYSVLAGFGFPSQRALVACFFLLLPNFSNHRYTGWQSWRYAIFGILLIEPHAALQSGFYLSFIAVAILMAGSQRFNYVGIKKLLALQFICLIGLMPFTLYWFSYGALNGFFANLIAIPLVGYFIVPLALIALLLSTFLSSIAWLSSLLKVMVTLLLKYLQWIDQIAIINITFAFTQFLSLISLALTAMILIFLPLRPFIVPALLLFFSAFLPGYPRIKIGDAQVDVLDVGQGLAIVIRTARHVLIYDTGMKFYQGGDMAQSVIIPYLTTIGVKSIDKIVISHPDLDHRGGLASLEENYPVGELLVDNVAFYQRGKNCHEYPDWHWDGVRFHFFSIKQRFQDKNNSSCVLQISNAKGKALFPGDIEREAEDYLNRTYKDNLFSNVLVAAHHGSKTSSSLDFIKNVAPKVAIISSGFDNRYHFPHAQTLTTLKNEHIKLINTANCGMITFTLNKILIKPNCSHKRKTNLII